jgi:hypothetical protein
LKKAGAKLETTAAAAPKPILPSPSEKPVKELPTDFELKVPPILLEGDEPSLPPGTGIGLKYGMGTPPEGAQPSFEEDTLPDAYGTGRLFLVPRDPHCLYAHWDLTLEQQQRYNGLSADRHLVLRLYLSPRGPVPVSELHVHPESRHWFIHVTQPGTPYLAELGYYQANGQWHTITVSDPAATPSIAVAEEIPIQFATLSPPSQVPPPAPFVPPPVLGERKSLRPAQSALPAVPTLVQPPVPNFPQPLPYQAPAATWAAALPRRDGEAIAAELSFVSQTISQAPFVLTPAPAPVLAWTPAQEKLLEEVIEQSLLRQEWIGSAEILQLIERRVPPAVSSLEAARLEQGPSGAEAVSSPGGERGEVSSPGGWEAPAAVKFWFKVNAELVVYGATEPDARVTIGGRRIRLRSDGTFSYRFSLPDGEYQLPIAAAAAHGDVRRAELDFSRRTRYSGEVGAHPQDQALKPPAIENVA